MKKLKASDIEIALALNFNFRQNIIVPNVYWGLGLNHEADMIIVSKSGYAFEIEIKTSLADIKADKKKKLAHYSEKIRRFSFAVPDYLADCKDLPRDCGLITVRNDLHCKTIRPPRINKNARPLNNKEISKILHLGCMRIWKLKRKLRSDAM